MDEIVAGHVAHAADILMPGIVRFFGEDGDVVDDVVVGEVDGRGRWVLTVATVEA